MSLSGKVAVVTGGASGIGRAICLQLARDGAAVSVWDLNGEGAEETVAMITGAGGSAIACVGDAAAATAISASVARTHAELGPITILVNNAGITGFCRFQEITEDMMDRMMQINIKGPFLCVQAVIPDMLAAGWGRVVNISSSSAQTGAPMMAHYAASKGGVIGLTKALAREYADKGITVNNIPPGFIDTPMLRASPVDIEHQAAVNSPMKRAGQPEDIAAACSYLVSEAAGYVTGHTLSVNGGRVMY
ncbi:MAG: SDR family oxidoreductase [Gammaproteobacteria bacterium]|jgi:2-hydroxycyclohexanecarboxyl-CoA dehydrogenase|nr:SDR family oxidoreductase [Gammaproteobacteria bacterium]MDH5172071.1 SDR family oxidoreductase [Gammaproteobacteria bacterium]